MFDFDALPQPKVEPTTVETVVEPNDDNIVGQQKPVELDADDFLGTLPGVKEVVEPSTVDDTKLPEGDELDEILNKLDDQQNQISYEDYVEQTTVEKPKVIDYNQYDLSKKEIASQFVGLYYNALGYSKPHADKLINSMSEEELFGEAKVAKDEFVAAQEDEIEAYNEAVNLVQNKTEFLNFIKGLGDEEEVVTKEEFQGVTDFIFKRDESGSTAFNTWLNADPDALYYMALTAFRSLNK